MSRASPAVGDNSGVTAPGQLRAFVERVERIEAEIAEMNADKSEIYKEMRGGGFDVKTVRKIVAKRKLETADREEQDAIFDLYWAALYGENESPSRVHVHEGKKSATTRGESDAKSAHAAANQDDLIDGRRREGEAEHQPLAETTNDTAPRESAADEISHPIPQSPVSISSPEQAKPEADSSSASGDPFEPPAFRKRDERNDRCMKQGDCKFARHPEKVTCSHCGTAWAISQRKRERAE